MKDKKLKVGTLCTIREGTLTLHTDLLEEDKGYWVVTKEPEELWSHVRAFSLKYQHHWWWKSDDLIPVVNSGG